MSRKEGLPGINRVKLMHFDNVEYGIVGWLKAKKSLGLGWGRRKASLSLSFSLGLGCVSVGGWEGRKGVAEKELGRTVQLRKVEKAGSALGYACAKLHPHLLASRSSWH